MQLSVNACKVVIGVFLFFSSLIGRAQESVIEKPRLSESEMAESDLLAGRFSGTYHGFGHRIAGTYLVTRKPENGPSRIVNIFVDGNLTSIQSNQFSSGALGNQWFSNQQGTWKRAGKQEIEALVLDLAYDSSTGEFRGTAIARYFLKFDRTFKTLTGLVNGKIYSPGVDPLHPEKNEPIGIFEDSFVAQRLIVSN